MVMTDEAREGRHNGAAEDNETSPLLARAPRRPRHQTRISLASIASSLHVPKAQTNHAIINILCAIILMASCSAGFIELPMTRLIEDILCHEYYDVDSYDTPIDERLCKEDAIQKKLAYLLAVQTSLFAVVGFLAAFPWGLVADKIGRRPVIALAMLGLLLAAIIELVVIYWRNIFPVTLIWASTAGQLVGGGNAVLAAVILSMIADATTEEDRAMAFLRIHIASLCGNLVSPTLSGLVMERFGPWIPPFIGMALFVLGGLSFLFLPETLMQKGPHQHQPPSTPMSGSRLSHLTTQFRDSLSMLKNPSLVLLLTTLLCSMPVAISTLQFLNQFVSKRYAIKIAQTGYVQTIYGLASIAVALIILPHLSTNLLSPTSKYKIFKSEQSRDLRIAQSSYLLLFLGALTLGLAPSLWIFILGLVFMALGSGSGSLAKSLLSIYVDTAHRSRLFSLVGMVEVLGSVYAQPMLAGLFSLGMKLDGPWIGLPYLGLAALIAVSGTILLFVRLPKNDEDGEGGGVL